MFGNRKRLTVVSFVLLLIGFSIGALTVQAAGLKDSDVDGIIDDAEIGRYRTDPKNFDTDSDGFEDGYEVVNGTDPLDSRKAPFMSDTDASEIKPVSWYAFRAIAFLVAVSVLILGWLFVSRGKDSSEPVPSE